ncbi:hypothetical protein B0T22DRAFT_535807 [Podospora appendiculata]|uniref:Uncharacterized protein n=1 Tax=Podospora appendiculata TaxID=314037 RepID=A0AAE1CCL8_9PEZI|nr:hypothetical protein B0T22DRAFT_535807 [Podospora appendiculata]
MPAQVNAFQAPKNGQKTSKAAAHLDTSAPGLLLGAKPMLVKRKATNASNLTERVTILRSNMKVMVNYGFRGHFLQTNPNEDVVLPPDSTPSPWAALSPEDLLTAQAIFFALVRPDLYDPQRSGTAPGMDRAMQRYVARQTFSFESADQLAEFVAIKAEELDALRSLRGELPGVVDECRAEYEAVVANGAEDRVLTALGVLDAIEAAQAQSQRLKSAREELQIADVMVYSVAIFVEAVERTLARVEETLARSRELKDEVAAVEVLEREVEALEARVEARRRFSNAVDGAASSTGVWEQRQAVLVKVRQLKEEHTGEYPDWGGEEVEEREELEELEAIREHLQSVYADVLADISLNEEILAPGLQAG